MSDSIEKIYPAIFIYNDLISRFNLFLALVKDPGITAWCISQIDMNIITHAIITTYTNKKAIRTIQKIKFTKEKSETIDCMHMTVIFQYHY